MDLLDFADVDEGKSRTYDLDNGNKITMSMEDPYGFVFLSLNRGALPDRFRGGYTSFDEAEHAISQYLQERERAIVDAKLETKKN